MFHDEMIPARADVVARRETVDFRCEPRLREIAQSLMNISLDKLPMDFDLTAALPENVPTIVAALEGKGWTCEVKQTGQDNGPTLITLSVS